MTLFFNLLTLEEKTLCDPTYMLTALYKLYKKQTIPRNTFEKYKPIPNLGSGVSFLLNPKDFFNDKYTDINHKIQYIRLAARRDYQLYKHYRLCYLDLTLYPDLIIDVVKLNPLFTISDKQLYFKYER